MRTLFLFLLLLATNFTAWARHGKGGTLTYEYLGTGSTANTSKYKVTATHYIDCDGAQFIETSVFLGIFNAGTNKLTQTITIAKSTQNTVHKVSFGCINPAPNVCFVVSTYVQEIELENIAAGYILAEQECCRIQGIANLVNSSTFGGTNTTTIPGVINNVAYHENSSPLFAAKDTAVICYNSYFVLDFSAKDADGDSLAYGFCAAKAGGSSSQRQPNPPAAPPYSDLTYAAGFSGSQPLGVGVTINPKTGIISGTAPATTGKYIVSVCAFEYRKGVLINTTKKEVQVEVAACNLSAAVLKPEYINCKNYSITFENLNTGSEVTRYSWDFGVSGTDTDVSSEQRPTFTYEDTGRYVVKLKVSTANGCTDSTMADVAVYPGFSAGFTVQGSCFQSPFQFTDTTKARYGTVNKWEWTFFGTPGTSSAKNPAYQFPKVGTYTAELIVSSSKGCTDTIIQNVNVYDRPELSVAFRDTLICSIDTLPLKAIGQGTFAWTPQSRIIDANTATPKVYPLDTTTYVVTLNQNGCIATDSVRVNVLPFITVSLPADTIICRGDSIMLNPVSHALQYSWSPATSLSNANIQFPMAAPQNTVTYTLTASLGRCQDKASIQVKVVPYPQAYAGADTVICYSTPAQLRGAISGSSFTWTPTQSLRNASTLSPLANPLQNTAYVLTAMDTLGCPKAVSDTVLVQVIPQIMASAGRDTAIVAGQPLQLQASGGETYSWSPATGLNSTSIANPVALLGTETDAITYSVIVGRDGCFAVDTIRVIVFKLGADILVPSAFTPNNDGRNDIIKPILIGMKQLEQFQVFNRWGQLVYSTRTAGQGWDGRIGGVPQASGVYVYIASGISFEDKRIIRKGTLMLVR